MIKEDVLIDRIKKLTEDLKIEQDITAENMIDLNLQAIHALTKYFHVRQGLINKNPVKHAKALDLMTKMLANFMSEAAKKENELYDMCVEMAKESASVEVH